MRDSIVRLRDGRALAYVDWGEPSGWPLVVFHGTPGSRLDGWAADDLARTGARQITIDRPGYGRSDLLPGRRLTDWADDVEQVADALGLDRFAVAGGSGGAPHALACAAKLGDRVTSMCVNSPGGPYFEHPELGRDHPQFASLIALAKTDPQLAWQRTLASCTQEAARIVADPEGELDARLAGMPEEEQILTRRLLEGHADKERDMLQQGGEGWARDYFVCVAEPWGFRLSDITTHVHIWSGDGDAATTPSARWLAAHLPSCTFHEIRGAGHAIDLSSENALDALAPG